MELFENIRKDYFNNKKTIRQIAKIYGVHRRQVRLAIQNAIPPARKTSERTCKILTPVHKQIIDGWLEEDLKAPRKQTHTGKRVFERLVEESDFPGAEITVRRYVYQKRKQLDAPVKAFVPQVHLPGEEAEVDWYEAMVDFFDGRKKVYIFQMRACYSGREFHMTFHRQNQQAFLEGHIEAFRYFGGVFKTIRYDNLTSAVKKVLYGHKRHETDRFIALRSHYLFKAVFCTPGLRGAHEKGGVESGGGRFRRSHLVPVPKVSGLLELNQLLLSACQKDDHRIIIGKAATVLEDWQHETDKLITLPAEPFIATDIVMAKVNNKSLVAAKGNYYSVPVGYVGQEVEVHLQSETSRIMKQGKVIAEHNRCYTHHQIIAELDHYLPLFKIKPGALPGSVALQQARQKWPILENYWQALITKYGQYEANRQLINLLWWARDFESDRVLELIAKAMELGCCQVEGVQTLMRQESSQVSTEPLSHELLGNLACYDRPQSTVDSYNQLITGGQI